jgi:hypothetical protein
MSDEDDEVEAEVQALLASTQMDQTADYLARGRTYQHLVQNELLDAWIGAFIAMVDAGIPGDLVSVAIHALGERSRDQPMRFRSAPR